MGSKRGREEAGGTGKQEQASPWAHTSRGGWSVSWSCPGCGLAMGAAGQSILGQSILRRSQGSPGLQLSQGTLLP